MTKKDHQKIAETINKFILNGHSGVDEYTIIINLVGDIADMLEKDNPKFNRNKFLALCNS